MINSDAECVVHVGSSQLFVIALCSACIAIACFSSRLLSEVCRWRVTRVLSQLALAMAAE